MSGAFDSDNTSGSAWLGSSTRNLNKRARGNAWKKHSDLADAFLAGKEQHTDTARKNFSLSAASPRGAISSNSSDSRDKKSPHHSRHLRQENTAAAKPQTLKQTLKAVNKVGQIRTSAQHLPQLSKLSLVKEFTDSLKQDIAESVQLSQANSSQTSNNQIAEITNSTKTASADHQIKTSAQEPQNPNQKQITPKYATLNELLGNLDHLEGEELTNAVKQFISSNIGYIIFILFIIYIILF